MHKHTGKVQENVADAPPDGGLSLVIHPCLGSAKLRQYLCVPSSNAHYGDGRDGIPGARI
jgi:hypothetical protein